MRDKRESLISMKLIPKNMKNKIKGHSLISIKQGEKASGPFYVPRKCKVKTRNGRDHIYYLYTHRIRIFSFTLVNTYKPINL